MFLPTILIIDDDHQDTFFAKLTIRDTINAKIATEDDWPPAIRWLKEHRPDMVLLDINLPRGVGIQAVSVLKEHHAIPLVIVFVASEREKVIWGEEHPGIIDGFCNKSAMAIDLPRVLQGVSWEKNHQDLNLSQETV